MNNTGKFKTVINGYSKTEVDQYLDELNTQYQNEHMAISRLMLNAQSRSDQIVEEAEKQAAAIISEAESDRKRIMEEAGRVKADLVQDMRTDFIELLQTAEKLRKTIENSQEMYMLYSAKILSEIPLESNITAAVEKVKRLYPQTERTQEILNDQISVEALVQSFNTANSAAVAEEIPKAEINSAENIDDLMKSINAQRRG